MKLIPKLQTAWLPINPRQKFDTPWTKWAREQREAEEKAYQKAMNTPYYKTHPKPSKEEWKKLQSPVEMLAEIRLGEDVSEPVRAINNYIREFKHDMANNNVPKGKYVWPAFILGASGVGSFLSAPVTTAATMAGGYLGGQAVDTSMKLATDKTWALKMKDWTGLDEEAGEITNPGMWAGGYAGGYAGIKVPARIRAAAYDNITPFAYNSRDVGGVVINKGNEFKNTIKDFFSLKRLNPDTDNPTWMKRFKADPNYNENSTATMHNEFNGTYNRLKLSDMLDFRNQAWAKAMRQKAPNHKLYIDNGDGTVSYNMDYVNNRIMLLKVGGRDEGIRGWNGRLGTTPRKAKLDSVTGNGGAVGVTTESNGQQFMIDKWDLLPFIDEYRSLSPWVTKNLPFMRKFEAVSAVGGNPFILKHPIPTQY